VLPIKDARSENFHSVHLKFCGIACLIDCDITGTIYLNAKATLLKVLVGLYQGSCSFRLDCHNYLTPSDRVRLEKLMDRKLVKKF
jgi:hypothetical protein